MINKFWLWIVVNKMWLLSAIGLIVAIIGLFSRRILSRKVIQKNGDNGINVNAGGNVHITKQGDNINGK